MTAAILDRPTDTDRSGCSGTRHGTPSAYAHHRCRCDDAKSAYQARRVDLRRERVEAGRSPYPPRKPSPPRPAPPRITDPAVQVWSTSAKDRLRILVALGYDWDTLADLLPGVPVKALTWTGQRAVVPRSVAAQVQVVFGNLIRYPVPCGTAADDALDHAMAARWGVVDLVAVRRALTGSAHRDPGMRFVVPLTSLERRAVVHVGAVLGYSLTALCRASSLSGQTVLEALDGVLPTPLLPCRESL